MTIAEKIIRAKTDYDDVYDAGYAKGKADGMDYDKFWYEFQGGEGTGRNSYIYAFAHDRFNDETYNPKYPIICSSGTTTAQYMFYNAHHITDTKVPIDATSAGNMINTFAQADALVTIQKLVLKSSHTYSNTFTGCEALQNIIIEGTIGNNISFLDSPNLTLASLTSIINALETKTDGGTYTLTLNSTVKARLTDELKQMVADKGWQIK